MRYARAIWPLVPDRATELTLTPMRLGGSGFPPAQTVRAPRQHVTSALKPNSTAAISQCNEAALNVAFDMLLMSIKHLPLCHHLERCSR